MSEIGRIDASTGNGGTGQGRKGYGSGEVLFSAVDTLREGDLYVCALNPGGSGDEPHQLTIRESLARLPSKISNNYFDESWRHYPRGDHPLQRRLRLFGALQKPVFNFKIVR